MLDMTRIWYRQSFSLLVIFLLPFSFLFGICVKVRRFFYRQGVLKSYHLTNTPRIPVIVVGNITVGGTGKTPFVIWLVHFLKAQGYSPGIVSRGVGAKPHRTPYFVRTEDSAQVVGDEAILLQSTGCPLVVCVNRVAAVRELLSRAECDVIISDDGLQHYRLQREIEIVLVDGERYFGNRYLLPAGPLREPVSRLNSVDFVVVNGSEKQDNFSSSVAGGGFSGDRHAMTFIPTEFISLKKGTVIPLAEFPFKKVHAVCGIGNPNRFFNSLRNSGFEIIPHVFKDHYHYKQQDFDFTDDLPILMTEKDAVKCYSFAEERFWYLRITVKINRELEEKLIKKLKSIGV